MNREAVALGTPVYTIFTGEMGAVDEHLIAEGRLRPLSDPAAIRAKSITPAPETAPRRTSRPSCSSS